MSATNREPEATMRINAIPTESLATIVAGLVREGVTFDVSPSSLDGLWNIVLTGGF